MNTNKFQDFIINLFTKESPIMEKVFDTIFPILVIALGVGIVIGGAYCLKATIVTGSADLSDILMYIVIILFGVVVWGFGVIRAMNELTK